MTTPSTSKDRSTTPSPATLQESRAANEGMVSVTPPRAPYETTAFSLAKTQSALEGVLEAQNLALRAYDSALETVEDPTRSRSLEEARADLSANALHVRNLLARFHDQGEPETSTFLEALTGGVQRMASMFGDSSTLGTIAFGEAALKGYLQELATEPGLMPVAREALQRSLIPASVERRAQLRASA